MNRRTTNPHAVLRTTGSLAALLAALLLGTAALLVGSAASAGEIPNTAYSGSLLQPPELLDYPSLVFEYPQAASAFGSQVFALSTGSYLAAGGLLRTGRSGWFVLSQRANRLNGSGPSGAPMVFQAGWGTRLRPVRFGLAVRGSEDRVVQYQNMQELKWIEGSAGIGISNGSAAFDAAVDLRHESRTSKTTSGAYTTSAHAVGSGFASLSARGSLAIGRHTDLLAAGQWIRIGRDWDTRADVPHTTDSYADLEETWVASLGISGPLGRVDRMTASVSYENLDRPLISVGSSGVSRRRTVTRSTFAAASAEERIWRRFSGSAGLQLERSDENATSGSKISARDIGYSESFAWGLAYEWRNVRLAGSMSTSLQLLDPFYVLDVRVGI
jgi:hypothetical protein